MMSAWRAVAIVGLLACACATGRVLLQAAPMVETETQALAMLRIPNTCMAASTCPGEGPQIYTCNGTHWVNTNSNVTMRCPGILGAGVHNVSADVPTYTFACGRMQGNMSNQLVVPNPTGNIFDLPWYRRDAINRSGCLDNMRYVTRTNVLGGQPTTPSCNRTGEMANFLYTATFTFYSC